MMRRPLAPRARLFLPLVLGAPAPALAQPPAAVQAPESRAVAPDSATVAAVADSIAAEVMGVPVAGVAIGVFSEGRPVFRKAYGWADPAAEDPLTLADPHQVGSLTKQFTAAAVLQLVEEGRMSLDDPVQAYLPDFDTQGRTVTIHHLLNHTSGIRSYTSIYGMNPVPRETVLDTIQKHPFDFEPGERYLYNNSGYYLLGVVLEAATGRPYAEHLEDRIFGPLGLDSTSYCGHAGSEIPVGYGLGEGELSTSLLADMEFPGAAGGLCSTVDDLLAWQAALVSGGVVGPESYSMMTTPAELGSGRPMSYGYGLGVGELDGRSRVAHGGGIPGYNTHLAWFPAESLGVAVLVNTSPGYAAGIGAAVARAALGLPRPVAADLPTTAAERSRYVGAYDMDDTEVRIFERGDALMAQPAEQPAFRMKYQGDHAFVLDTPEEIRLVFEMEDGSATAFTLHQGGATIGAPRVEGRS